MFGASVTTSMMEKSMGALWQKQQLILHNIANEDTPGYKAKRMDFENVLRKEMDKSMYVSSFSAEKRLQRLQNLEPYIYDDDSTSVRADGNNVDIDSENIEMARVQIQWQALQRKISGHYSSLKYAVSGGR